MQHIKLRTKIFFAYLCPNKFMQYNFKLKQVTMTAETDDMRTEDWFDDVRMSNQQHIESLDNCFYNLIIDHHDLIFTQSLNFEVSTKNASETEQFINQAGSEESNFLESVGITQVEQKKTLTQVKKQKNGVKKMGQRQEIDRFDRNGETKNIPKNVGKQIIKFVKENRCLIQIILKRIKSSKSYDQLWESLKERRKKMIKISSLRSIWLDEYQFGRQMRVISNEFLRKYAYNWIFNSRIIDYSCHIKYKQVLMVQIKRPQKFECLKTNYCF